MPTNTRLNAASAALGAALLLLVPPPSPAATTNVTMGDYFFSPVVVTIHAGDTVNWMNGDDSHTVTGSTSADQSDFCGSGLITSCSKTFATPGSFPYECTLHVQFGMTGMVVVLAVPQAPAITNEPSGQTVIAGANASFSVGASGTAPLSYRWSFDGSPVPAATNATLVLTNVALSQAGSYAVTVTNSAGSATSQTATLAVYATAAASLTNAPPVYSNGTFSFYVSGVPGFVYVVQASSDWVQWTALLTNASPFTFVDSNAVNFPDRFYRAFYPPP